MQLPAHKTKIVCTVGPASQSREIIRQMLLAGMNIARINFSHGDFATHARVIRDLRATAAELGRRIALLADLPGPKIRIGSIAPEPVLLERGARFTLTTELTDGNAERASVSFEPLPRLVSARDKLFLNDGLLELEVLEVRGPEVRCKVIVGGELSSRKGVNLPGVRLGSAAFTEHDRACLAFALEHGVDAVSQSFVETAADVSAVREAARALGHEVFVIAKIERASALDDLDAILEAADGIMIARGDLGVELPIQKIPAVQKRLTMQANLLGKPVITATQMLESMIHNRRPTRAEATDVANAILDGTDCVMLSGESAVGRYPIDSVAMLAKLALEIEPERRVSRREPAALSAGGDDGLMDLIARSVANVVSRVSPAAVFVPTLSGASARSIARFRLPIWIIAMSQRPATCQRLQFSYGVHAIERPIPTDWSAFARAWVDEHALPGSTAVLTGGPSEMHPDANHRMDLLNLRARALRALRAPRCSGPRP